MDGRSLELDRRSAYGIEVTLMWEPDGDQLFVTVVDETADEPLHIDVDEPSQALEVFRHPYAYGARAA
jgi:hypothetical protein